jgi:hypothetical protein
VPRFVIKLALIGTLLTAPITPPVITYAFAHGGSEPWFAGGDIVGALLGLAPQPGSHGRRQASHERNFHRSHKAQRINASLKPHEAQRKTLLDQVADTHTREDDVSKGSAPSADRAPDQVQAAPASVTERETEQTVGMAPVIRPTDAAQNAPPPIIESKGMPITRSLEALSVVMVVVVALGLVKLLLRRTYVKQDFAFGVMRRLQRPANYVRQVDLLRRHKNQVEADYETVQRAANKALDRIAEAEAEIASSRQPS